MGPEYLQYLVIAALWALVPGFIAKRKDRSFFWFFVLSFLASPLIAIIVALCVPSRRKKYVPTESIIVEKKTDRRDEPQQLYSSENISGWRCSCGRVRAKHESSCICGKSKFDVMNSQRTQENPAQTTAQPATGSQPLFCRMCGDKLLENSKFCRKCGAKVEEA